MGSSFPALWMALILGLAPAPPGVLAAAPGGRSVAITIDDLPFTGGPGDLESTSRDTARLLQALTSHKAPAVGFVTTENILVDGQVDARLDLLRGWLDAGAELGNHSYSHPSFQKLPLEEYKDDAVKGDLHLRRLLAERGLAPRFYRHPFNHTGPTAAARQNFEDFMGRRGYQLVPFTVEHSDYAFNTLHADALSRGDAAAAARVQAAYLEYLDTAFAYAEELAHETFGRDIPQVFLIHANGLNALCLEEMLTRLQARGYRFSSLEEAMQDPAYRTPDPYVGPRGISWLHRWRQQLGQDDRLLADPDPPSWILRAYRDRAAN